MQSSAWLKRNIRLNRGWLYLVTIMDWFSRYVVSWELSTSLGFIGKLKQYPIRISMDGRGRAMDNIFTERLWRSLKYEEVYLKD